MSDTYINVFAPDSNPPESHSALSGSPFFFGCYLASITDITLCGSWHLQRFTLIVFFRATVTWRRLSEYNWNVENQNFANYHEVSKHCIHNTWPVRSTLLSALGNWGRAMAKTAHWSAEFRRLNNYCGSNTSITSYQHKLQNNYWYLLFKLLYRTGSEIIQA